MFGIQLLLKSYLKPLPLNLDRYLFKKKLDEKIFSLQLKDYSHPVYLRKNSSDIAVFNQIFYKKEYDINFYGEPKVIIDCGANVGMTSVYFANRYPNAKIIAVEPEKENFEMLLKNTKHYPNVTCINYGLWHRNANLEVIDRGEGSWSFIVQETESNEPHVVKAVSIDGIKKMFDIKEIDVLKIDIEGSEKEVFESGTEKWLPSVKTMVLELHDKVKHGCTKALIDSLSAFDYAIEPFCESIVVRINNSKAAPVQLNEGSTVTKY